MRSAEIIISFLTAFGISAGGVVSAVAASGYKITSVTILVACIAGIVSGCKDVRSFLRLPPVNGEANKNQTSDKI